MIVYGGKVSSERSESDLPSGRSNVHKDPKVTLLVENCYPPIFGFSSSGDSLVNMSTRGASRSKR